MIFKTLLYGTIREAIEKKIILAMFILIGLIIFLFLLFINLDSVDGIQQMFSLGGDESYRENIIRFTIELLNPFIFLSVFFLLLIFSASYIPSMLEKGSIDVLLSKPVSRSKIIIAKFLSVVFLAFIILTFLILLIWLMISIKTGIWHFPFLTSILWFTLIFAILYSFQMLLGVITQSSILSLVINLFILFPVSAVLSVRELTIFTLVDSGFAKFIVNFLYYILPKAWDIREICVNLILGVSVESYQAVITSVLFMFTMISFSVLYFSKKDY